MRTDEFLIEVKCTEKQQYILKRAIWEKIRKEALTISRQPMMVIHFSKDTRLVVFDANYVFVEEPTNDK